MRGVSIYTTQPLISYSRYVGLKSKSNKRKIKIFPCKIKTHPTKTHSFRGTSECSDWNSLYCKISNHLNHGNDIQPRQVWRVPKQRQAQRYKLLQQLRQQKSLPIIRVQIEERCRRISWYLLDPTPMASPSQTYRTLCFISGIQILLQVLPHNGLPLVILVEPKHSAMASATVGDDMTALAPCTQLKGELSQMCSPFPEHFEGLWGVSLPMESNTSLPQYSPDFDPQVPQAGHHPFLDLCVW